MLITLSEPWICTGMNTVESCDTYFGNEEELVREENDDSNVQVRQSVF